MTAGVGSMQDAFEKVGEHHELIHRDIIPRVEVLEKEHSVFKQEMTALKSEIIGMQKGQKELEVTVMKDGKETRELLKPFADHVLSQAQYGAQTEREIAIKKLDTKDKIAVALYGAVGSGGLVTIVAGIIALFK